MTGTNLMALPSPFINVTQYKTLVESFPKLSEDEERSLAKRLRDHNDLQAAWQLVCSHLRCVVYIARGYSGYGLPQEDLIQEGNLGLMKAVQRFDPSRGVRLMSYANYWIKAQIHDFILRNWRIVKVATTKARRKLFYKLRAAKQQLKWMNQEEAAMIANNLDVTTDDVFDMEGRLYLHDAAFDAPVDDARESGQSPASYLEDHRFEPESLVEDAEYLDTAYSALREALAALDERSRDILSHRWLAEEGEKQTLQQLGDKYGVSAERIRQIESNALQRLRAHMAPRLEAEAAAA